MIALALLILAAAVLLLGAPTGLTALIVLPAVLWAPGLGFACALRGDRPGSGLQRVLDAGWIGAALTWLDVALIREAGVGEADRAWALFGLAAGWTVLGLLLGRRTTARPPTPRRELIGAGAVVIAVFGLLLWRQADIGRPLDAYWFHPTADEEGHPTLPIGAGTGWAEVLPIGWPEAGALALVPGAGPTTLRAEEAAAGRILVVARGPEGATLRIGEQEATIRRDVAESEEEGPVRRYLDRGAVALAVEVDLPAGGSLPIETTGDAVYLLPGTEAVWSAHASGELRFTHYYQLLNQVENLDWASEFLEWRRFVWNQPPGWSPLLSTATVYLGLDMPAANLLFLWVVGFVGLHAVRLASLIAPGAPLGAFGLPAGFVAAHGLLMLEPASANFPDNLFAGAVLACAIALVERDANALGALGVWAQALRWPGTVVVTLLALGGALSARLDPRPALLRLWGAVGIGVLVAIGLVAVGEAEDLSFILYFETFPEHWHDDYAASSLLPRIPEFYALWLRYSGGGLAVALGAALLAKPSPARQQLRGLLIGALAYSALLCTVDHHPTHYFLPLMALTGPMVVAAAASSDQTPIRVGLPLIVGLGLWTFLAAGSV